MPDEIAKLPVKFKAPPKGDRRVLEVVNHGPCNHVFTIEGGKVRNVTYLIDPGAAEVQCSACGTKLNPMWVLAKLAHQETRYHEYADRYQDEMKRLGERSRTRCDGCGKMTRISKS
jgi:hypothetical protein